MSDPWADVVKFVASHFGTVAGSGFELTMTGIVENDRELHVPVQSTSDLYYYATLYQDYVNNSSNAHQWAQVYWVCNNIETE
jgi:hypothetical protein